MSEQVSKEAVDKLCEWVRNDIRATFRSSYDTDCLKKEIVSAIDSALAASKERVEELERDLAASALGVTEQKLANQLSLSKEREAAARKALDWIVKGPTRKNEASAWDNLALHGQDAMQVAREALGNMSGSEVRALPNSSGATQSVASVSHSKESV